MSVYIFDIIILLSMIFAFIHLIILAIRVELLKIRQGLINTYLIISGVGWIGISVVNIIVKTIYLLIGGT